MEFLNIHTALIYMPLNSSMARKRLAFFSRNRVEKLKAPILS